MLPTLLGNKINDFKLIRKDYFKFYEIWKEQEKQRKELIDQDQTTYITSLSFFTMDELTALSKTIGLDYEQRQKDNQHQYSVMLQTPSPHHFSNFNDKVFRVSYDYHNKQPKTKSTITLQERYNTIFSECIKVITNLDIQIYNIESKLKHLKFDYSTTLFIFHCKKGNVDLNFNCFVTDDYKLGGLSCYKTTNTVSNEAMIHHITFDLKYSKDTNDYSYKKFIAAIHGIKMSDFKQELYSHMIALPQLLATYYHTYPVYVVDHYFNSDVQDEIEDYKILVDYGVSFNQRPCVLTPISHDTIYLSKEELSKYPRGEEFYEITYKSEKQFSQLIEYIDAFAERQNGYGYKCINRETGCEHRGNDVVFKKIFPHLKVEVARDVDNLSGFDLYIVLSGYQENPDAIMSFIPLADNQSCILDYYGIRFLYDKRIDPLNCVLSIDCKCCDISTLVKQGDNHYLSYHKDLKSFDQFKIHDSYQNCVKVIKELIALLK